MTEPETESHVEIALAGGETIRVEGDLESFEDALRRSKMQDIDLVRFTEVPRRNPILVNPERILAARAGAHPVDH